VVDTSQGPLELELSLPDVLAPPEPPTRAERGPMQLDPLRQAALMDSISKLLESQDFDSVEEMEAFLEREIVGREPPQPEIEGPQDEARELALQALDFQGRRSLALVRKALELDPNCAHAHLVLADRAHDTETAINHYRDAIAAAERTLGPEIFEEEAGFFWGISETRPYMQAVKGLADTLYWSGQYDEAAEHFTELLRLNPNDNQGVRDILAPALMLVGDNTAAQRLLDEYSEDETAAPAFNAALVAFRRRGDTKVARKRLARALKRNTHIAPLLLGRTEMPDELPSGYTLGSVEEAAYYFSCAALAWANSFGALDWLAAVVVDDRP
jgi:tetratricopeptide (TPR) repeat protein